MAAGSSSLDEMLRQQQLLQQMQSSAAVNPNQFVMPLSKAGDTGGSSTGIPGAADYTGLPPISKGMSRASKDASTPQVQDVGAQPQSRGILGTLMNPVQQGMQGISSGLNRITGGLVGKQNPTQAAQQQAISQMPNPFGSAAQQAAVPQAALSNAQGNLLPAGPISPGAGGVPPQVPVSPAQQAANARAGMGYDPSYFLTPNYFHNLMNR